MKKFNLVLGAVLVAAGVTSCKDEKKETAKTNVDHYVVYVDSINGLDSAERAANWAAIQAGYEARQAEAEAALAALENDAEAQKRIEESKSKYDGVKMQAESEAKQKAEAEAAAAAPAGNPMADKFFGPGNVIGNDMTFAWVNKDNILGVYQKFYETFDAEKDAYTRQDLDKVKAWYEALDNRKNTVEKEGLSGEDNRKIAAVKLKFAPKFRWERMTAKGEENQKAKDKAN
ncbi:hypothetical protein R1T16_08350 [Flavobacterium sp. DG1-102-2]|uniref:hypothetical protein n=1 Tax=Flavobacterium sp. DG1-102-2 TaxID=3081663 RepID=UPI00294A3369|nr:hypothetical protein [Flavobacterium sp. DG1-102-2]MDV6168436.1 hypothetical protein [Flavobacterium sp. DG1-102-2]